MFPTSFTVLNPGDFASSGGATPTTGINTGFQHQWLVSDQDLSLVAWSIQGVVAITGSSGGGESDKFTTSVKDLAYIPQAVPEPATIFSASFGSIVSIVIVAKRRRSR